MMKREIKTEVRAVTRKDIEIVVTWYLNNGYELLENNVYIKHVKNSQAGREIYITTI